jgi:probable HAF family extracellular repeat protein
MAHTRSSIPAAAFAVRSVVLAALACIAASAAAQDYTVDFLAGGGGRYNTPAGINNHGRVVGTLGNTHHPEAVVWNANRPDRRPVGLLPEAPCCTYTATYGEGINNRGQVAGQDTYRAALWTGTGRATVLPQLAGHTQSYALDLNDAGHAVGYTWTGVDTLRATLWEGNGSVRDLGTLGGRDSFAYAINEAGTVVGASHRAGGTGGLQATMWQNGIAVDLGFADGLNSEAYDVNDHGVAVGVGSDRAVLWNDGEATFLDGTGTRATAINNAGLVVGYYYEEFSETPMHAVLWNGSTAIDLNRFLSAQDRAAGWRLDVATDINDHGWIVGRASNSQGFGEMPFVMSIPPIPEPASLGLMAAGLAVLWGARRTRGSTRTSTTGGTTPCT